MAVRGLDRNDQDLARNELTYRNAPAILALAHVHSGKIGALPGSVLRITTMRLNAVFAAICVIACGTVALCRYSNSKKNVGSKHEKYFRRHLAWTVIKRLLPRTLLGVRV